MQDVLDDVFRCIAFGDLDICTKPSHSKFPTVAGLYRAQEQKVCFGNFKPVKGHKLFATKISSPLVADVFDCVSSCISDSRCNSINFAVSPDSNKLHVCELLDIDKYRATAGDLQVNVSFLAVWPIHGYWVSFTVLLTLAHHLLENQIIK